MITTENIFSLSLTHNKTKKFRLSLTESNTLFYLSRWFGFPAVAFQLHETTVGTECVSIFQVYEI